MYKHKLLLLLAWVLVVNAYGQNTKIILRVNNPNFYPISGNGYSGTTTSSTLINSIFTTYGVTDFSPAYPIAYTSNVPSQFTQYQGIYIASCNCNGANLVTTIKNAGVTLAAVLPKVSYMATPNDYTPITLNTISSQTYTPNQGELWYLDKIKAQQAWDITQGSPDIKIAVIDVGFDVNHEELSNKIHFQDEPFYTVPTVGPHGTFTASLAAGATNNGVGLSSIGYNSKLMLYGDRNSPANQILSAALNGANVISMSFSDSHLNPSDIGYQFMYDLVYKPEQDAINIANQMGVFIVAAAGNGLRALNPTDPNVLMYPASYDNVFSVTSTWYDDNHSYNGVPATLQTSHQHNEKVDLCAPGFHIWKADFGNKYSHGDGTSFACPIVAGTVALIKAVNPYLTNTQIEDILKNTSDNIYSIGTNNIYAGKLGAGRLNAFEAVKAAKDGYTLIVKYGESKVITLPEQQTKILVKAGGKLTITNTTLSMAPFGKIVVEAGGKLYANGVTFKSITPLPTKSPFKWQGIIIEGDRSQNQRSPNLHNQGLLVLTNCIVQDAMNAITTKKDANDWNTMIGGAGGVLNVSNTLFKNNGRHVELLSYHNNYLGVEQNNKSRFSNCKFEVDDGAILTTGNKTMITAWDVKGVMFEGCEFSNTYMNTINLTNRGTGILAVDAALIIQDVKANGITPSVKGAFTNLQFGVKASFDGLNDDNIIINNMNFNKNFYAVVLASGLGGSVYRNSYNTTGQTFLKYNNGVGFSLIGFQSVFGTAFKTTENTFISDVNSNNSTIAAGSDLNYADKYSNGNPFFGAQFTLNKFQDNYVGASAGIENQLLNIQCNDFYNSFRGVLLKPNDLDPGNTAIVRRSLPYFSLCTDQKPTDYNNTFRQNSYDIHNVNAQNPNHTYVIKTTEPNRPSQALSTSMNISDCNNPTNVQKTICPVFFAAEPVVGPLTDWREKKPVYYAKKGQLPRISPGYPSAPAEPCHGYIHNDLTTKEMQQYREVALLRSDIVHDYVNAIQLYEDNLQAEVFNEYIQFLKLENTTEANKMLVSIYYNHEQFIEANELLPSIKIDECDNYWFVQYYTMLIKARMDGRNIFTLTDVEKNILYEIAESKTATSAGAKGVIELVYNEPYVYPLVVSTDAIAAAPVTTNTDPIVVGTITITPNPTAENPTIGYTFTTDAGAFSIAAVDWSGMPKGEWTLAAASGSFNLPSANWSGGLYVIQLKRNQQVVAYKVLQLLR
jgi:subtilisin family serine protease